MTKKQISNTLYALAFIAIGVYFAYSKGWIGSSVVSLSPMEVSKLLENDTNVTLLDVRTPQEFASEHIEGATLIPVSDLEQNLDKLQDAKNKKILVYCRSGSRSVTASRILLEHGFSPINMSGGINQWKSENLPLK
ncbi:MAG: rhodanese-like domain-containing protein [Sulfurovum sp.]|nr:MAG: rhodanese-like domain-containing protein [Sulfurovum sp.]